MQFIASEKDKMNNPIIQVEISEEEITLLKKTIEHYPKDDPPDSMDKRLMAFSKKENWEKLSGMNITDLKETVARYVQFPPDNSDLSAFNTLNNDLGALVSRLPNLW